MLATRRWLVPFALVVGLMTTGWLAGCTTTKAAPLEVTYFYLPG